MKIQLITRAAGPEGNYSPGSVIDDKNGKKLVEGGYAISLEPEGPKEEPKKEIKNETPKKPTNKAVKKNVRK